MSTLERRPDLLERMLRRTFGCPMATQATDVDLGAVRIIAAGGTANAPALLLLTTPTDHPMDWLRAHPQILLRIGWAPVGAEELPLTPRRSLDDIVASL